LIVVSDGMLNKLPLSLLPFPTKNEQASEIPLIFENEIIYQPSALSLELLEKNQKQQLPTENVVVFSDPIFTELDERIKKKDSTPESTGENQTLGSLVDWGFREKPLGARKDFLRLEFTRDEAEHIAEIVGKPLTKILSGEEANTKNSSALMLKNYQIIHFATHAEINEQYPEFSGIVLSLYDEKGTSQNGFLRLSDIYGLQLSSSLVILSSCNSGRGKEIKGEGVISLTQGFIQAGSKSVVSTLWKVHDKATAQFMKYFYEGIITKKLTPSKALQEAQIQMRQNSNYKSPFFWAPFTLQGEFRYPIIPVKDVSRKNNGYIVLTVLGISVGLVFLLLIGKRIRRLRRSN
jgi:CHAT domain-containing protein